MALKINNQPTEPGLGLVLITLFKNCGGNSSKVNTEVWKSAKFDFQEGHIDHV